MTIIIPMVKTFVFYHWQWEWKCQLSMNVEGAMVSSSAERWEQDGCVMIFTASPL